jgi:single-stranded-DNA-specific exonuclease
MSDWQLPEDSAELTEFLGASLSDGVSDLVARVCWNRNLRTLDEIRTFLHPKLESLTDPFRIRDMEAAVSLCMNAMQTAAPILIYGDYDVDGTTGAALLSCVFSELGVRHQARQPDRFLDGYGLGVPAVESAHADGFSLLITVDCGISSFAAIQRAKELGLKVIVLDHHQVDPVLGLPPADAIVNPQRSDCESGLKQLCGCALGFYFSRALRTRLRDSDPTRSLPNLKQHLDLVVLATAADQVPLTGDNRILVRHGLQVLQETKKPGLKALMQVAGVDLSRISPSSLGFAIGPRINASGRLASANLALQCLTTTSATDGQRLARSLDALNAERADLQNAIWDEVRSQVETKQAQGYFKHAIVVADPGWHEGVVGIVASRVVDHFKKPAIVLAIREDGIAKGSARTLRGINVLQALHDCKDLLLGYGGHKMAAGLTLSPSNLDAFVAGFDRAIGQAILEKPQTKDLKLDGRVNLKDLKRPALEQLEQLGPFGPGNPEPAFSTFASVGSMNILKGRHLKLQFESGGYSVEGIWFHAAERPEALEAIEDARRTGASLEWAGVPELNRFRGASKPSVRVRDFRLDER